MVVINFMNVKLVKAFCSLILFIIALTALIVFLYESVSASTLELLRGEDYFDYHPMQFMVLLLLPVGVLVDIFFIGLLFPFRKKMVVVLERLMIPVTIYGIIAMALGFLISLVVSIYPLGTHYYKCNSTSVISSGSYYARTKEMCKERARLRALEWESSSTAGETHSAAAD